MMNPKVIINKNYTPDQKGQEIRQEDVVWPLNRKITTMNESMKWKEISRSQAPTYGSCEYCFRSGPLGKRCNQCNNGVYQAILLLVKGGAIETLDSITISEIMGQGHEVCLADHEMNWNQTPCRELNMRTGGDRKQIQRYQRWTCQEHFEEETLVSLPWLARQLFLLDWWEGSDDNRSVLGGTRIYDIHENPNVPWQREL